jgi:hypothetical protein
MGILCQSLGHHLYKVAFILYTFAPLKVETCWSVTVQMIGNRSLLSTYFEGRKGKKRIWIDMRKT